MRNNATVVEAQTNMPPTTTTATSIATSTATTSTTIGSIHSNSFAENSLRMATHRNVSGGPNEARTNERNGNNNHNSNSHNDPLLTGDTAASVIPLPSLSSSSSSKSSSSSSTARSLRHHPAPTSRKEEGLPLLSSVASSSSSSSSVAAAKTLTSSLCALPATALWMQFPFHLPQNPLQHSQQNHPPTHRYHPQLESTPISLSTTVVPMARDSTRTSCEDEVLASTATITRATTTTASSCLSSTSSSASSPAPSSSCTSFLPDGPASNDIQDQVDANGDDTNNRHHQDATCCRTMGSSMLDAADSSSMSSSSSSTSSSSLLSFSLLHHQQDEDDNCSNNANCIHQSKHIAVSSGDEETNHQHHHHHHLSLDVVTEGGTRLCHGTNEALQEHDDNNDDDDDDEWLQQRWKLMGQVIHMQQCIRQREGYDAVLMFLLKGAMTLFNCEYGYIGELQCNPYQQHPPGPPTTSTTTTRVPPTTDSPREVLLQTRALSSPPSSMIHTMAGSEKNWYTAMEYHMDTYFQRHVATLRKAWIGTSSHELLVPADNTTTTTTTTGAATGSTNDTSKPSDPNSGMKNVMCIPLWRQGGGEPLDDHLIGMMCLSHKKQTNSTTKRKKQHHQRTNQHRSKKCDLPAELDSTIHSHPQYYTEFNPSDLERVTPLAIMAANLIQACGPLGNRGGEQISHSQYHQRRLEQKQTQVAQCKNSTVNKILGGPLLTSPWQVNVSTRQQQQEQQQQQGHDYMNNDNIRRELEVVKQQLEEANRNITKASTLQRQHFTCMSHEIRTPLNCIVGMASLLHETHLTREQKESVEMIIHSSNLLMSIVDDVLDYSKLSAGNVTVNVQRTSLQKVLDTVIGLIKVKAQAEGMNLQTFFDADVPEFIDTDGRRLQQILFNLLGNATKFNKVGKDVELHVKLVDRNDSACDNSIASLALPSTSKTVRRCLEEACLATQQNTRKNKMLRFIVKDYGKGISENEFPNIFKPFCQGSVDTNRVYGGTGLGLAITAKLVAALGGTIKPSSEVGQWTEFCVDLPVRLSSEDGSEGIMDDVRHDPLLRDCVLYIVSEKTEKAQRMVNLFTSLEISTQLFRSLDDMLQATRTTGYQHGSKRCICLVHEDNYKADLFQEFTEIVPAILISCGPRFSIDASVFHFPFFCTLLPCVLLKTLGQAIRSSTVPQMDAGSTTSLVSDGSLPPPAAMSDIRRLRVLVAEDNIINQKVIGNMLQRLGVRHVDVVDNGLKATEFVAMNDYDLVLMDMQMPIMDGVEACRIITNTGATDDEKSEDAIIPATKKLKRRIPAVVFVTAHVSEFFEVQCRQAGAVGFLPKPFKLENIQHFLQVQCPHVD